MSLPLAVRDLVIGYGDSDFRLTIPSLDLAASSTLAVVGVSGSGKTTLIETLCGIQTPSQGTIRWGDRELTALAEPERRALRSIQLGLVFQDFELLEFLSVFENLLVPFQLHPQLRLTDAIRDRARVLLRAVHLEHAADRSVTRLSRGERQRVALARALLPEPAVLLADEPTASLDPTTSREVVELILEQTSAHSMTLLFVTHERQLLERFDRVLELPMDASS